MNATVTPHEYVQAKGWDLMCIVVSADELPDEDAQNADKYVEGGAHALRSYCRRCVREIVKYRAALRSYYSQRGVREIVKYRTD